MRSGIFVLAGLVLLAGCAAPSAREQWTAELRKSNRTLEAVMEEMAKIPREGERTALLEEYIRTNPAFKAFAEIKLLEPDSSDAEKETYLIELKRAWETCRRAGLNVNDPLMKFFLADLGAKHVRTLKKVAGVEQKEEQMRLIRGESYKTHPIVSQILRGVVKDVEPGAYVELVKEDSSWMQYLPSSAVLEAVLPVVREILEERNDYEPYYFSRIVSLLLDSPENIEKLKAVAVRKPRASCLLPMLAEMDGGGDPLIAEAWEYQKHLPQEERIRSLVAFSELGNREALELAVEWYAVPENRIHLMQLPFLFSPRMPKSRKPEELKAYYDEFRDDWSYNPLWKKYERNEFKEKEDAK